MINNPFSKKELLFSVFPGNHGAARLGYAKVNGSRATDIGEGMPAQYDLPFRAAVFSPDSYFELAEVNAPSEKMLPLVARRHLDRELVFQDESYRLRARSRVKRERTITADIAALPESDFEAAYESLKTKQSPCLQVVPVEIAIAALLKSVTSEPAIVFWEKNGFLLSLLLIDGAVRTRMCERVSDSSRETVISRAEASLKASAELHEKDREIQIILFTGDLCELNGEEAEKSQLEIRRKILARHRAPSKVSNVAVLRDPEIYGLPLVHPDWNFLEPEYRQQVRSWQYARPAALMAAAVGILLACLGSIQHLQALSLDNKFQEKRANLDKTLAEIARIRPSDDQIQVANEALRLRLQSQDELRLDRMLDWLTHLVPEGVVIRSMRVEPAPPPARQTGLVPVDYAAGKKPFLLKMELMFADNSLESAEASSGEILRRLSRRLQMIDSKLEVPAPDPDLGRKVVLAVNAMALAQEF